MKLFAKLMIAALILAVLLPFTILKGRDGKAMMSFTDFSLPDFSLPKLPKLPNIDMLGASDENLEGKDIFYKWFDAKGNVQFTTEPPADGIEYTVRGFDPNTNVIQAVDVPAKETTADKAAPSTANPEDIGSPYSQESIKKLFEDAKNIEKLLKQRAKDQESALNQ